MQDEDGEDEEGVEKSPSKQKLQFPENDFFKKWDEEHPPIPIPDEVEDDIDNDYDLDPIEEGRD